MQSLALVLGLFLAPAIEANASLTADEALELAFPECAVERRTIYLTKDQRKQVDDLAGFEVETGIVYVYTARKGNRVIGHAYFDTHKVRTKGEALMLAVDARDRISRLELLAFAEPREYIPAAAWYAQFLGRELNAELRLKGDVRGVAGATLTARATTRAVRRMLALHAVVHDRVQLEDPEATGAP